MSPMFGGKKRRGKTVAIVDIESGSVGAALAHLLPRQAPKLFGETRIHVPILHTRDAHTLSREVERVTQDALLHVSTVAARLRNHDAVSEHGDIDRAAVFVSAPWATMHLRGGTADFTDSIKRSAHLSVRSTLGEIPTTFHPQGTALAHSSLIMLPRDETILLSIINAEVSELLVLQNAALLGRATVPTGSHALLRTLVSHSGMSHHEARSYLTLPRKQDPLDEPLLIAADNVGDQIEDAARDLGIGLSGIMVIAHEPNAEFLAQALARNSRLGTLFPEGGTVRAAKLAHIMPYIAAHSRTPDIHLMLEALFVNAKFLGI